LNTHRHDKDIHRRKATAGDVEDVADYGACRRSNDSDVPGDRRDLLLVLSIKKPLLLEAGLELLEGLLKGAEAFRLNGIGD